MHGGCVGALVTMALGLVVPLGAKSESEADWKDGYFDEITCRSLRVVLHDGVDDVVQTEITPLCVVASEKGGGSTRVDAHSVNVYRSKLRAHITADSVVVGGDGNDTSQTRLSINKHGGSVSVHGRGNDLSRAVMSVNEYGNGAISTWDKNGYRLATLGK